MQRTDNTASPTLTLPQIRETEKSYTRSPRLLPASNRKHFIQEAPPTPRRMPRQINSQYN